MSAAPAMQKPPAEQRRPRDARAYIRPLAEHQVPRLPRKSHRQSSGDQKTPGRTSDPLQSTKCCACHAKATGRAAETKGRQSVHRTPCRAPSAAPATQKPPAEQRRPRDARAYSGPLAEHQVLRLPRKSQRQSTGDQGTPGRTSDPLRSTKCRACRAKATGRAAETKGRQGVHRTPCRAPSAAPATQKPAAEHRRPRDARAYIRPLAEHQVPRLPCKSHRQSSGDQGTPERTSDPLQSTKCRACYAKATGGAAETKGRQGVHRTPCRAPSAAPATQKPPAEQQRPRDARAYIGPLAEHQVLRLSRQSHRQSSVHRTPCRAPSAAPVTQKPPAEDQGTPGRTSDTLQSTKCCACHTTLAEQGTKCCACHAKPTGRAAETKGRQGVHPTPCRAPSAAPATQKPPRRAPSAGPATQKPPAEQRRPRDARAYIRPLDSAHCPTPATQKPPTDQRRPRTPARTSDPLQSTKCCACHAKATGRAAETKGRQGVHPTPCRAPSAAPATQKPAAEHWRPRDAGAYIRPLAEHQVLRLPRKSHRQSSGDQGTPGRTSDPLQSTKCCACHAKATGRAAETKGRQGVHPTPCGAPSAASECE